MMWSDNMKKNKELYLVRYQPNPEEVYIMYASFNKLKCEEYILKIYNEYKLKNAWFNRANDMYVQKIKLDIELDYE